MCESWQLQPLRPDAARRTRRPLIADFQNANESRSERPQRPSPCLRRGPVRL